MRANAGAMVLELKASPPIALRTYNLKAQTKLRATLCEHYVEIGVISRFNINTGQKMPLLHYFPFMIFMRNMMIMFACIYLCTFECGTRNSLETSHGGISKQAFT